MKYTTKAEKADFEKELLRFIRSEMVGDGTIVTKNGRVWLMFPGTLAMQHFPNKSYTQIKRMLESLVDRGVLVTEKISQQVFNQSNWYAFYNDEDSPV